MSYILIEFFVVIAIIAILAAMLLPVLNRVRGHGYSTRCISNLKQQDILLRSYIDDNKEYYIPWLVYEARPGGGRTGYTWPNYLLLAYKAPRALFDCPSFKNARANNLDHCGFHYIHQPSSKRYPNDYDIHAKMSKSTKPSRTISIIGTTVNPTVLVNGQRDYCCRDNSEQASFPYARHIGYANSGVVNMLLADGLWNRW